MKDRKKAILSAIINEHVSNEGLAVSSKAIVDKYDLLLSPATIRNEMAELEDKGFIYQPHTSAGRVPTEKGWQYYIENYLDETVPDEKQMTLIEKALHKTEVTNKRVQVKNVAKELADMSKNAVFVGFDTDDVYYTGLANLFGNPEFNDIALMYHMSEIIDHLDDVVEELFSEVTDSPRILIGSENPFGKECSTIFGAYQMKDEAPAIFGILGPMRMDYANNVALINFTKRLFAEE